MDYRTTEARWDGTGEAPSPVSPDGNWDLGHISIIPSDPSDPKNFGAQFVWTWVSRVEAVDPPPLPCPKCGYDPKCPDGPAYKIAT
jgi:hypothetical protein